MFTTENNSRLVNDNAICHDGTESRASKRRIKLRSVSSLRGAIDTLCEGGGPEELEPEPEPSVENNSCAGLEQCTEEEKALERRRRTRSFSHRRSTSCSTVSPSSSGTKGTKRKRKKKHKHHHRHRSNRLSSSSVAEKVEEVTPTPKVNPIFVWIKQDDTRIVQVLCEDYDRRNRIRLTKTSNGWRSIPLTETLEKRWPFAVATENVQNQLVKPTDDSLVAVVSKADNPLENKQQTDNYKDDSAAAEPSSSPPHHVTDLECRISSTSRCSPASSRASPAHNDEETSAKVPLVDNGDPFDSDESTQDDLRSIINKVQTDSLYSDDEQSGESHPTKATYPSEFCPVNSTCDDENDLNNNEDSNTIQCAEVSGNEVQYSEPDTNFESQSSNLNGKEVSEKDAAINQTTLLDNVAENDQLLATVTSNVEKCPSDKSTLENSFQSVTSQNENIEFASHKLSLADEILQFNNKQKYHDRTSRLCQNDAEYFDLGDDNVQSSISSPTQLQISYQDGAEKLLETRENLNNHCPSPEETVSQSNKADYVLDKEPNLKCEPNRCGENEVSSFENITEISDNEAIDDHVNSSSKCEFASNQSPASIAPVIKTENVDTHEVIDDHSDDYDPRKDDRTPELHDKLDDQHKKVPNSPNTVVLRTPLCQTLKTSKPTCRKPVKKTRTIDDLKTEPLPAHMQPVLQPINLESSEDPSLCVNKNTYQRNVQNEPLDLGISRAKNTSPQIKPAPPTIEHHREQCCRKRTRSEGMGGKPEKEPMEPKALKKSRLLDLLTSKNIPYENCTTDPLEQLKDVLANPKYSVPDPLLVPKARLSALVSSPGKEIPKLLARRAQDVSYFSILSDPDVLVVSLSHLKSLLEKPINEDEIQKYQKQTEEIRGRMREECFNNNYENMANGNWNQCYWLPSFQHSSLPPFEQPPPEVLSVLNCIPPPATCCGGQDVVIPNNGAGLDYQKQMLYQKDAALWQEFALQQLAINHPSYDQFNNNISSNCELAKDGGVCGGMVWNQDVCPNYACFPSPNTLPIKSNVVPTKNSNLKYFPSEVPRKRAKSFGSTNQIHMDYHLGSPCDADLFADAPFLHGDSDKMESESKLRDRYDTLRQFLLNSTENADFLQQFEASLHPYVEEERKSFKDERQDNRPQQNVRANNNANIKEPAEVDAATKPSRPVVPKIKVRKHLVDPNQRPTLLNNIPPIHPIHVAGFPAVDHNVASHLWNPFFCSNIEKNYKKLQWTTPATSNKAD